MIYSKKQVKGGSSEGRKNGVRDKSNNTVASDIKNREKSNKKKT